MDFLRRLVGAQPARELPPEIPLDAPPPVSRKRDELTSFMDMKPEPAASEASADAAPAEATEVVQTGSTDAPVRAAAAAPPPAPEPPEAVQAAQPAPESVAPPAYSAADDDMTVLVQAPAEPEPEPEPEAPAASADPEATLYLELPQQPVVRLTAIKGELEGQEYELHEGENRLGRSPESDVVLASMWISRSHAKIVCQEGRVTLQALTDKVTTVNGEPAGSGAEVADGGNIQLGGTVFVVHVDR